MLNTARIFVKFCDHSKTRIHFENPENCNKQITKCFIYTEDKHGLRINSDPESKSLLFAAQSYL